MVKKFFIHLLFFIVVLGSVYYALSNIGFRELFKVEKRMEKLEGKLNRWTIRHFENEYEKISDKRVDSLIVSITSELQQPNNFQHDNFDYIILQSEDINAFALPGNTIIIFSELLNFAETQEEFLGVVAHEIAHIEENHVIKKLSKEIGLAAIFTLFSGSNNLEVIKEIAKITSSTAYDRELEREADSLAVDYLFKASINPQGFIDIMTRFAMESDDIPHQFRWISSHPETDERVTTIQSMIDNNPKFEFKKRDESDWNELKEYIRKYN
jgi:beta-barrel assembly-enhancing protease